jgi:A/G-specific adenine glycosylase
VILAAAADLLRWYDRHRRALPWRTLPGQVPDPYRVWLSEIMLQQTTVGAVIPYYENWLAKFPSVEALAAAEDDRVMAAWAGLGYYARARNLLACARAVVARGGFPESIDGLRALPGIGPYTASAVAAIAFGVPVVPVDGNVERVATRLFAIETPLPGAKPAIREAADRLGADPDARARPSDFAQALFDLGATICTPSRPACGLCPWHAACLARQAGIAEDLPRKAPKAARPQRFGVHFWLQDFAGRVLLRRRPPKGLLGGMTELPGPVWRSAPFELAEIADAAPMPAEWRLVGRIFHGLTHFELAIDVYAARVEEISSEGFVCSLDSLTEQALPSVMRKCVTLAMKSG